MNSKRVFLKQSLAAAVALLAHAPRGYAGPLDSIPLERGARLLREGVVTVPARTNVAGVAASDAFVPQRGWLTIAFALEEKIDLTLMVLTDRQRSQILSGQALIGDPLARISIEGPETATQTVTVDTSATLFVAFVNAASRSVPVAYRVSFRAF